MQNVFPLDFWLALPDSLSNSSVRLPLLLYSEFHVIAAQFTKLAYVTCEPALIVQNTPLFPNNRIKLG